ncbi:hypothetical protein AGR1C_Cc30109 [Agrobacterium fabacearum TT111]|nr:hypothetical protein AGR1C_Cc30109 [Agrobacterium fabacearum TT111]
MLDAAPIFFKEVVAGKELLGTVNEFQAKRLNKVRNAYSDVRVENDDHTSCGKHDVCVHFRFLFLRGRGAIAALFLLYCASF